MSDREVEMEDMTNEELRKSFVDVLVEPHLGGLLGDFYLAGLETELEKRNIVVAVDKEKLEIRFTDSGGDVTTVDVSDRVDLQAPK